MTLAPSQPLTDAPHAPSAPRHRAVHCFESEAGAFFLPVDGSKIFRAQPDLQTRLAAGDDDSVRAELTRLRLETMPANDDEPPPGPRLHALSLAVAQKCNLGCTYCYAQEGAFGGRPRNMPMDVALRAVALLFRDARPGDNVSLAFLGGEPLFNRAVIHAATEHAARLAAACEAHVRFAITTNGTLLEPADADFFESHGFAVTVSLDGVGEIHDRQRAFKNGPGSFAKIIARVQALLDAQRRMQVSARVTVTAKSRADRDARNVHRTRISQRRIFAPAPLAHGPRSHAPRRPRADARPNARVRAALRRRGHRRPPLSLREHGKRPA